MVSSRRKIINYLKRLLLTIQGNLKKWHFSAGAAVTNSTAFGLNGYGGVDVAYGFNDNFRIFADANLRCSFTDFHRFIL